MDFVLLNPAGLGIPLASQVNHVSQLPVIEMEGSRKENRASVLALFQCRKTPTEIFKILKPLGFSRRFVYRTIDRYKETGGTQDRPRTGRPRSVRTTAKIKAVRARIARNPLRKQKILAREMNTSARTMSRIIGEDLGLRAYRRATGHLLTPSLKKGRKERSKALLSRYAGNLHRKILFTDEKIFTVEEKLNKQNDRVYATSSKEAAKAAKKVERGHHPSSVMVWWGVSWEGVTTLHFCDQGVKMKAKTYQEDVLENVVLPLNDTLFAGKHWIFQQDSAPAHKAKSTQAWLRKNLPEFITAEQWPSGSPDLNPLDYKLWSDLEDMACRVRHPNIESLKRSLENAVANFPMEKVRAAIDEWPGRLKACVRAKGGHFEI